jgi:hypothetical protein
LQVANPIHINVTHFDKVTKFDSIYYVPTNPLLQKAKAARNEEEEEDDTRNQRLLKLYQIH